MSFAHLKNNTKDKWWQDPCLRKNVYHCVGLYFCVFYLGYVVSYSPHPLCTPLYTS